MVADVLDSSSTCIRIGFAAPFTSEHRDDLMAAAPKELGLNFARLAEQVSECSSARKQGDLGFFGRGQMQRPFEEASFALACGEMSQPISTDSGVHIILRTGWSPV